MPSKSVLIAQAFSKTGVLSTVIDSAPSVDTGLEQITSVDNLPTSGNDIGDQLFIENTNRLYIWNGSGWFNIALINTTPTWDSGGQPVSSYDLSSDSPQTATIINLSASDPEGIPISYTYVTSGQMDSIATVSQDSSVFTITPKTEAQAPDGGTGSITFRASDGVNILPYVSSFTLTFSVTYETQEAELQSTDLASGDAFGTKVAIDGDTIIVGAQNESHYVASYGSDQSVGAAYVFTRSGTTWTQEAKLQVAPETYLAPGDKFGDNVAIEGDTAVITASRHHYNGTSDTGAAYVFTRSGTSWTQRKKLVASDAASTDRFGSGLAIHNGYIVIGAYLEGGGNDGSAYVYQGSGSSWTQRAILGPNPTANDIYFGSGCAMDGNTIVVSGSGDNGNTGAAYVFTGSSSSWSQQAKLVGSNQTSNHRGDAVAIDGDTILYGCGQGDNSNGTDAGEAYIFTRSGSTWTEQAYLEADDGAGGDRFGHSVALYGDIALVGAYLNDTSATTAGKVYIFERSAGVWSQVGKYQSNSPAAAQQFGISLGMTDTTAVIGTNSNTAFVSV